MTQGRILRFWAPLASTWLMMSVEGPLVAAVIARLDQPKFNLAAFGLAFSVAMMVESPIVNMLMAATALVRDRLSYLRLRAFAFGLSIAVSGFMLLLGLLPIYPMILVEWIGLPHDIASLSRQAVLIMVLWPGAIGYRRFYQGILIAGGRTRSIAFGTVLRLVAMAITAFAAALWTPLSGALVGALALTVGVVVEALAVGLVVRTTVRSLSRQPMELEDTPPSSIAGFYYPLALTSMLAFGMGPAVSFLAGLGHRPVDSLAALPVILSLVFIFRSLGLSFQEAAIALLGRRQENLVPLRKFARTLAFSSMLGLGLVALTPLADFWFRVLSGLSPDLAAFAIWPTRVMILMPAFTTWLVWLRSLLVNRQRTTPISWATLTEVVTTVAAMGIFLVQTDWSGALAATVSFVVGRLAGCLYLVRDSRKTKAANRRRTALSDPSQST